jgi:alkylation response protein AidB-like acyl-CoA dehydrogenase
MATTATPRSAALGGSFLLDAPRLESVFTPADLSDDQRLIGQTAEEFVAHEVLPRIPELELHKEGPTGPGDAPAGKNTPLMAQLLKKAGELGLLGGGVPEEYGGSGLDRVSSTVLSEKASAYASFSVTVGAHSGIGTLPIVYFGTDEQKKKYLPKLATGEWIACYCLSEPQAGSDAQNARTRAVLSPDGRHWILNGQKMWISNGGFGDIYIVFAKVDGEKFSCFIVERDFPGFSVGAEEKKMGLRGSSTVPIFFENCQVPRENLLHEIGRGHIVAFNILNVGRFSLGAACIGGAKNEIEASARYAQERTAFGHRIGEFGLIRAKLAEMAIRTFALESMIYRTAGLIEQATEQALEQTNSQAITGAAGKSDETQKTRQTMKLLEEYAIECSISKVYGSEVLDYVVDEAVQIYGGYGFHEDYPVARGYRDSRVNRIFEGTNEINRMLIIQMLVKRALSGSLPLLAAGAKLQEEILSGPSFPSIPSINDSSQGPWSEEERIVAGCKKVFLLAAGAAMQKHREHLADQQEIVAALADIVIDIYAVESALARAQKAARTSASRGATSPASAAASGSAPSLTGGAGIASAATLGTGGVGTSGIGASGTGTSGVGGAGGGTGAVGIGGGGAAAVMAAAARVLLHDGAARVEGSARTVLAAVTEGDLLRTQLAVLRRLAKREPADTIALRRTVADAVESANRYPF